MLIYDQSIPWSDLRERRKYKNEKFSLIINFIILLLYYKIVLTWLVYKNDNNFLIDK